MRWPFVFVLVAGPALLGCGNKPAREVCEQAADHFERCLGELFGPDTRQLARDHRELGSCANDAETVRMYEKCEPQKTCDQYLDCIDGYTARRSL
jgi:hypothetical protein